MTTTKIREDLSAELDNGFQPIFKVIVESDNHGALLEPAVADMVRKFARTKYLEVGMPIAPTVVAIKKDGSMWRTGDPPHEVEKFHAIFECTIRR
jgi:hypothetical protein